MQHPERSKVRAFVDGSLEFDEAMMIESHVMFCGQCKAAVEMARAGILDDIVTDDVAATTQADADRQAAERAATAKAEADAAQEKEQRDAAAKAEREAAAKADAEAARQEAEAEATRQKAERAAAAKAEAAREDAARADAARLEKERAEAVRAAAAAEEARQFAEAEKAEAARLAAAEVARIRAEAEKVEAARVHAEAEKAEALRLREEANRAEEARLRKEVEQAEATRAEAARLDAERAEAARARAEAEELRRQAEEARAEAQLAKQEAERAIAEAARAEAGRAELARLDAARDAARAEAARAEAARVEEKRAEDARAKAARDDAEAAEEDRRAAIARGDATPSSEAVQRKDDVLVTPVVSVAPPFVTPPAPHPRARGPVPVGRVLTALAILLVIGGAAYAMKRMSGSKRADPPIAVVASEATPTASDTAVATKIEGTPIPASKPPAASPTPSVTPPAVTPPAGSAQQKAAAPPVSSTKTFPPGGTTGTAPPTPSGTKTAVPAGTPATAGVPPTTVAGQPAMPPPVGSTPMSDGTQPAGSKTPERETPTPAPVHSLVGCYVFNASAWAPSLKDASAALIPEQIELANITIGSGAAGRGAVRLTPAALERKFPNRSWQPSGETGASVTIHGDAGSLTIALSRTDLGMALFNPPGGPMSRSRASVARTSCR